MIAYDCYAAGKKIAQQLSEAGHKEWSDRIADAIAYGCTSGGSLTSSGSRDWPFPNRLDQKYPNYYLR